MSVFFGSGVGQSAGLVVCNCIVPGSAIGGILAFLLCAGLPTFVNNNNNNNNNLEKASCWEIIMITILTDSSTNSRFFISYDVSALVLEPFFRV